MCVERQSSQTKVDLLIHALHGLTAQVTKMTARLDDLVNASGERDSAGFDKSTARGD